MKTQETGTLGTGLAEAVIEMPGFEAAYLKAAATRERNEQRAEIASYEALNAARKEQEKGMSREGMLEQLRGVKEAICFVTGAEKEALKAKRDWLESVLDEAEAASESQDKADFNALVTQDPQGFALAVNEFRDGLQAIIGIGA